MKNRVKSSMLLDNVNLMDCVKRKSVISQYAANVILTNAHRVDLKGMELKIVKAFRQKLIG